MTQNFNQLLAEIKGCRQCEAHLPHLRPRNNIWLKKNPWFEKDLVPELKRIYPTL